MRIGIGEGGQADFFQVVQGAFFSLPALERARGQQREHHVVLDGFPWRQLVELLEHHDAIRARAMHGLALQSDLPFPGLDETGHRLEQGRLAAARGPEQDKAVGLVHFETDLVGGPHHALRSAVLQAYVIHLQQRRRGDAAQLADRVALQWGVHALQLPCSGFSSWKK
ncbi:hypothetical protein D3C76_1346860 [compost metagenome]